MPYGYEENSLSQIRLRYYICPKCHYRYTSDTADYQNPKIKTCYECKKSFPPYKYREVRLFRKNAKCAYCLDPVSFWEDNLAEPFYICSTCNNIVAINLFGQIINAPKILKPPFFPESPQKVLKLIKGLCLYRIQSPVDKVFFKYFQRLAKKEYPIFDSTEEEAIILLKSSPFKPIGYLCWTIESKQANPSVTSCQQIYIIKTERRKGYGTRLFTYWVKEIAQKKQQRIGVYSPNNITIKILRKTGFVKKISGRERLNNCILFPSN